ncbi:hypothetical protein ACC706_36845, partial [Rhizobium johnstonii]
RRLRDIGDFGAAHLGALLLSERDHVLAADRNAAAFNPAKSIMDQVIEVTRIHQLMSPDDERARAVELFRALSLPEPETIGSRYPHKV